MRIPKHSNLRRQAGFSIPLASAIVAGVIILAYAGYAAYPLASGPRLTASAEQHENGLYIIQGTAKRVSSVSIDEFPIPIDDRGNFAVERSYPPGYTVVIVRAEDRFGRTREQTLTFVNTYYIEYASKEENTSAEETSSESGGSERNDGGQTSVD